MRLWTVKKDLSIQLGELLKDTNRELTKGKKWKLSIKIEKYSTSLGSKTCKLNQK